MYSLESSLFQSGFSSVFFLFTNCQTAIPKAFQARKKYAICLNLALANCFSVIFFLTYSYSMILLFLHDFLSARDFCSSQYTMYIDLLDLNVVFCNWLYLEMPKFSTSTELSNLSKQSFLD